MDRGTRRSPYPGIRKLGLGHGDAGLTSGRTGPSGGDVATGEGGWKEGLRAQVAPRGAEEEAGRCWRDQQRRDGLGDGVN